MVKVLLDTNILIDYLNGLEQAQAQLNHFEDKAISLITWMEVMIGTTAATQADTSCLFNSFFGRPVLPAVTRLPSASSICCTNKALPKAKLPLVA